MDEKYNMIDKNFKHVILEGTHYEIGQQIAESIKDEEFYIQFLTSGNTDFQKLGFEEFKDLEFYMEEASPGINSEMQGVADNLGVNIKKINYYDLNLLGPPGWFGCTIFSILGRATDNNHVLTGRNVEWNATEDDFRLYTTRVNGKFNHIGFSNVTFGRTEGLNEHGLSVAASLGHIPNIKIQNRGFLQSLINRTILENCKTVEESMKWLKKLPVQGFWNFIIADKKSNALLVECADGIKNFRQIDSESSDFYVSATNAFTLPETINYNKTNNIEVVQGSLFRHNLVKQILNSSKPNITKEIIRSILSTQLPNGVCAHWYTGGFGTDWSVIFDNSEPHVEICFGAPTHNEWRTFSFDEPRGVHIYKTVLPDLQH